MTAREDRMVIPVEFNNDIMCDGVITMGRYDSTGYTELKIWTPMGELTVSKNVRTDDMEDDEIILDYDIYKEDVDTMVKKGYLTGLRKMMKDTEEYNDHWVVARMCDRMVTEASGYCLRTF